MATATVVICRIEQGALNARLEIDYDDATDPENLVAVRCVNGLARPVLILFQRVNKTSWFEVEVPAGATRSQNAGGPIRNLNDLPYLSLRTG